MTSGAFSGSLISTYLDTETIRKQEELIARNPAIVKFPDSDIEDPALMIDAMIDPFSDCARDQHKEGKDQEKLKKYIYLTESSPLNEAYIHLKLHQSVPKLLCLHQTTEADFEKPLIYSPIPFPDSYVLTSNSKRSKLVREFFETDAGFHYLRLFLHLKIEKFHYSNKNLDIAENDIFRTNNIAQYCPRFLKGHGAEERLHCSKQVVRFAKELDENPLLLEDLSQMLGNMEILEEVNPKFEAYRNQSDVFEMNFQ